MLTKNSDILIYVPFNNEKLNETELKWINAFQTILEISLRQITKQGIRISNFMSDKPLSETNSSEDSSTVIIQLLLNKSYEPGNLLADDHLTGKKLIQISCHPDIKLKPSKRIIAFNLFDEALNKTINLTERINELKNEVWLKFLDIAYELKKDIYNNAKNPKKLKRKIFVAETSSDQNFNRETIIRELEHLGFEILPKNHFPKDMNSFSELVYDNLKQAFLSIHLIGNLYAPLLNNIDISSIELQNDLFHEVSAQLMTENKIIRRLVWIPPDVKPKSEKQKLYIESFKRNIELLKNTEIIQTPIEVFKTIIRNHAEENVVSKAQNQQGAYDENNKSVYLIQSDRNNKNSELIKEILQNHKINILETIPKANKIDLIQEHYRNLINCDALLIDYATDNIQWLNSKLTDVLKSPGFGRKKTFLAKSILLHTSSKPHIHLHINDLDIIQNQNEDMANRLNSFIEKINIK